MSCYAFFKGWLLLSQPPGCMSNPTSFALKLGFRDLRRWCGFFSICLVELSPHRLTAEILTLRIQSLVRAYRLPSRFRFSALPLKGTLDASPKAISRRTSYHPVRLEFLPYAQLIPYFCSNSGFGPPVVVTPRSSWPCVAHAGFGSNSCDIKEIVAVD